MFSENHKISDSQIRKMLIFDIISISILIIPGMTAAGAGKDGLLAVIGGCIAALLYSLLLLYFTRHIHGEYMDYCQSTVGKYVTFFIGLYYIIKLTFSAWFTLSLFSNVINQTLLPNTSYKLILAAMILVAVYSSLKGIEVRARIAEILFFIVMIPLFVLFLLGLRKIDATNLLPLFTMPAEQTLTTGYSVLLTFSAAEFLLFAVPALVKESKKHKRKKSIMAAILTASAMNILLFITVIGFLGVNGASGNILSSVSIFQVIEIPGGFVQRQDAIVLTFWMMSIFTILSTYFYYLGKISNKLIKVKKQRYYLFGYAILLFFIASRPIDMDILFSIYGKFLAYIGFPLSIAIPAVIILIGMARSPKKGDHYEKNS